MERLTDEMLKEIAEYFEFDVKVRGGESEAVERGRILLAEVERLLRAESVLKGRLLGAQEKSARRIDHLAGLCSQSPWRGRTSTEEGE